MRSKWLIRKNHEQLLVFFTGWGMDEMPFKVIGSREFDVFICFGYNETDTPFDMSILDDQYRSITLLCWSMGVVYGNRCFAGNKEVFKNRIALNGTLTPIDNLTGIPEDIFNATLQKLDKKSLQKFYFRMCKDKRVYTTFLENKPQRQLDDIKDELQTMYTIERTQVEDQGIYNKIIITDKDYVFPTENQKKAWKNIPVVSMQGAHFPFYNFTTWEDLIRVSNT